MRLALSSAAPRPPAPRRALMSAIGTKPTSARLERMSAFEDKSDMTPAWCLSKSWDDVLGEGLHLAHFLVERHEALVEEPAEPFQLAFVPDAVQRLNLALHLVGRAGERVLDLAHTLKGPLRRPQRRVRLLVGLGHHADLADHTLIVDLAWRAVGARPFVHRPTGDALLVRIRHLIILAVVVEGLLGPGLLDDLERLLVHFAVVIVD